MGLRRAACAVRVPTRILTLPSVPQTTNAPGRAAAAAGARAAGGAQAAAQSQGGEGAAAPSRRAPLV